MPTPFNFAANWLRNGDSPKTAFAFFGQYSLLPTSVALTLKSLTESPETSAIALVGPAFLKDDLLAVARDSRFSDRLPERFRKSTSLSCLAITDTGRIEESRGDDDFTIVDSASLLPHVGMRALFRKHNPVLNGASYYHFRKPSGAHTDRFIRVADLLNDAVEIEFLASWLVQFITPEIGAIYCDTPSISCVAYAALSLYGRFNLSHRVVEVNTFHSFAFVRGDSHSVRSDALYLISTTTAAHLEAAMIEKGVAPEHIVTLFSVGNHDHRSTVLCNLSAAEDPVLGPITNYREEACPLCHARVPLVEITGDNFVPIQTKIHAVVPVADDAPDWLSGWMGKVCGKATFSCHHGRGVRENVREIHIDIIKLLHAETPFLTDVFRHLKQSIPFPLDRIY